MKVNKVLIIGGSGGIGSEIIRTLISEGVYVINIDRNSLNLKFDNYFEVLANLTTQNVNEILEHTISEHKGINGFISSIGNYNVDTLDGYTHSKYCDSLAVNIDIPTQFSVAISQIMRKQHFGKMIFVSSAAAYVGSRDIPYSISKAAILGLVRGLAKNLSGENVFVYGIAPGIVETNMSSRMNENRKNDAISGTINKRICQPSEIAKAVRFLLIEEDGYMNGSVIHINNGLYFN